MKETGQIAISSSGDHSGRFRAQAHRNVQFLGQLIPKSEKVYAACWTPEEGLNLVQKDMQTASEYYLDALEQVQYGRDLWYAPDVYLRVADFLKDGIVTEKNLHSAYDFYVSAAEGFMNRIENGDLDCADSLDLAEEGAEACRRILGQ